MEWNDTALVLHAGRFREADMWLRLLTQHHGIVQVFAFGGSRSRRRFCGCLDVLNTLSCRVRSTKQGAYLALEEGVLLSAPMGLRRDYRRLGVAMNCVRFTETMGITPDTAADAFALLQAAVAVQEQATEPQTFFPLLYRLRLACVQGQAPALDICGECGAAVSEGYFRVDEGQMLCPVCVTAGAGRYLVRLGAAAVQALRLVEAVPPSAWAELELGGQAKRECARAIDGFVQYHLGIAWQEGRFCRV